MDLLKMELEPKQTMEIFALKKERLLLQIQLVKKQLSDDTAEEIDDNVIEEIYELFNGQVVLLRGSDSDDTTLILAGNCSRIYGLE